MQGGRTFRSLVAGAAAAAALTLAACGGDGGGGADVDGPATLVPSDAPFYAEAVLRPQGPARDGAEQALSKILDRPDPGARLIELVDKAAADDRSPVRFEADIEPWLGKRAGIFFESFEDEPDGALIFETTDPEAAQAAIDKSAEDPREETQGSYEGIDYLVDEDGDAAAVVGDMLVIGDEPTFKQVIDVSEGDASLAEEDEFSDRAADLPDDALGELYASSEEFIKQIRAEEGDPDTEKLLGIVSGESPEPLFATLTADGDSIDAEVTPRVAALGQSDILEQLPADVTLALAVPNLRELVEKGLEALEEADIENANRDTVELALSASAGLDLDEDVLSWVGDLGFFMQGSSEKDLRGAAVITSTDPQKSQEAIRRISDFARQRGQASGVRPLTGISGATGFSAASPDLPEPLNVAAAEDRVVIGVGTEATKAAIEAPNPLGESALFQRASDALGGDQVTGFFSVAPLLQLAESGGAGSDPDYRQVKPYFDGFDFFATGSGEDSSRISLGLAP